MVVIHGVGEGVLKQEIRKELKEFYPHFDFYDASYQEYGYGATEIELKYKH
jgi:dsDNA-specific endonuclease/ATPase MutS2